MVGPHEVTKIHSAYAQGAPGEVFAIMGSMGFLEIAANRASAAEVLGVQKGTDVGVLMEQNTSQAVGSD
jgi:S-adenosylmethionine hydrolase